VPPLISQEEALRLGQIEDHAEIDVAEHTNLKRCVSIGHMSPALWNPAVQLRHMKKRSVPLRPHGAPNA
jgi:hypothetical protein